MVSNEGGAISAGKKQQDFLEGVAEAGNRHVSTAHKAVSGADNGSHCGNLSLCGEETVANGGEGCSKEYQHHNIQYHPCNVGQRHIITHGMHVNQSGKQCNKTNDPRDQCRGNEIADGNEVTLRR